MREDSIAALTMAAGGLLRPVIAKTFALDRAAHAHAAIEARATIGKTLLLDESFHDPAPAGNRLAATAAAPDRHQYNPVWAPIGRDGAHPRSGCLRTRGRGTTHLVDGR